MHRIARHILGVLAVLPLAWLAGIWTILLANPAAELGGGIATHLHITVLVQFLVTLACFALHALSSPVVTPGRRALWFALLVLLSPLTMPAYWWYYLRAPRSTAPTSS